MISLIRHPDFPPVKYVAREITERRSDGTNIFKGYCVCEAYVVGKITRNKRDYYEVVFPWIYNGDLERDVLQVKADIDNHKVELVSKVYDSYTSCKRYVDMSNEGQRIDRQGLKSFYPKDMTVEDFDFRLARVNEISKTHLNLEA